MYKIDGRIRYSEVASNKQIDLFGIINYFQDCSTFQSEDIGKGLDYLEEHSRVWVLSSWQIVINRFPKLCEKITTGTWPYGFSNMYGYRNFIMYDQSGEECAVANSIWVLMSTETNRPVKITDSDCEGYTLYPKHNLEEESRKIILPKEFSQSASFAVSQSNIDTNNHVNNGQYIKMAQEFLPNDFVVHQMRAEYKKPALLGDIISPKISVNDSVYTIVLANTEGMPYSVIEFK